MDARESIRDRMRELRRAVPPEVRAVWSQALCDCLWRKHLAGPVAVYLASSLELDLGSYISRALVSGVPLVAPRWNGKSYDLAVLDGLGASALRTGPMGIAEPALPRLVAPVRVRTWLVPGLAFTRSGARLGYGGGWYDRLLAQAASDAPRLGVACSFQLVDALDVLPHDIALTEVVLADAPEAP